MGKLLDQKKIYSLLDEVSRTFALSIKALGKKERLYISHAYLVCRLLDTFEDDPEMALADKKQAIKAIQNGLKQRVDPEISHLASVVVTSPAEKELVTLAGELVAYLKNIPVSIADSIVRWAVEMGDGMMKYAFAPSRKNVIKTIAELDDYCYFVAGTVGNMVTDIFLRHRDKISVKRKDQLHLYKENFGKALQLVNIIKDSPGDWLEGRCYIPADLIKEAGLTKNSFFSGKKMEQTESVYKILIKMAAKYLSDALLYTTALPVSMYRMRLFCILPIVFAQKTLILLNDNIPFMIEHPNELKITRKDVKKGIGESSLAAASNSYLAKFDPLERLS